MEIEMNDNASVCFTISIIALCVCVGCMYGCKQVETTKQEEIRAKAGLPILLEEQNK